MTRHPGLGALDQPGLSAEAIAARLVLAGVTSSDLNEALADAVAAEDAGRVARILATFFHYSAREAVPLLCTMLVSGVGWHLPEDVAELLGDAEDPRAIDPLVHIVDHPPADDFNGFLGEKVVASLSRFDDPRARDAIARAARSPQPRVWQAAIAHAVAHGPPALLLELGRRIVLEDPEASFADEVLDRLAALGTAEARSVIELAAQCRDQDLARHAAALLR